MDQVTPADGTAPGIALPGVTVGAHTTVGPASLVMRGEALPAGTRWRGEPIAAWPPERVRRG